MRSLGSVIRRDSWGLLCRQTVISMNLSKDHHRKLSSVSIRYESGEDAVFFFLLANNSTPYLGCEGFYCIRKRPPQEETKEIKTAREFSNQ
jgi:hypothetical protein